MPGPIRISCISVIDPMLKEAPYVEQLATDLAKQDFAGEVEILVAFRPISFDDMPRPPRQRARTMSEAEAHGSPADELQQSALWQPWWPNRPRLFGQACGHTPRNRCAAPSSSTLNTDAGRFPSCEHRRVLGLRSLVPAVFVLWILATARLWRPAAWGVRGNRIELRRVSHRIWRCESSAPP